MSKMHVIVNTHSGIKRMRLAEALTPSVPHRQNQAEQALALAKLNACMIGAIAAALVEKGLLTVTEASAAAGQCGIMNVISMDECAVKAPVVVPAPVPMAAEWKPKLV